MRKPYIWVVTMKWAQDNVVLVDLQVDNLWVSCVYL